MGITCTRPLSPVAGGSKSPSEPPPPTEPPPIYDAPKTARLERLFEQHAADGTNTVRLAALDALVAGDGSSVFLDKLLGAALMSEPGAGAGGARLAIRSAKTGRAVLGTLLCAVRDARARAAAVARAQADRRPSPSPPPRARALSFLSVYWPCVREPSGS